MYVHFIILISTMMISSFAVSQYSNTHDVLTNPTPSISKWGAFLTFTFLIFFGANRTDYIDTRAYLVDYYRLDVGFSNAIDSFLNNEEGGFVLILTLIKTIFGADSRIFLLIMMLIK